MITPLEQQVLDHIDDEQLIRWVQELTRIPSVWRPEIPLGEEAAAHWVASRCLEMGLETTIETVRPGRPNVIAIHKMNEGPTLMFEGHTDVVTEGNDQLWTYPPFSATLRDGKIYGRGANDMKAGLVCALMATRAIALSEIKLKGSILIGALCDEEGEMLGIKHFIDQGWADRVSAAIICEPEENHLCIAQKGVMWLRATIRGVMAHGAMPLTGCNSAYPMANFVVAVHKLEDALIARYGKHEFLGQPSITPTILQSPLPGHGAAQNNVMPDGSTVTLDCRLIPGQEPDALRDEIANLLEAASAVDGRLNHELELLELRHPTATDRHHPVVSTLASAYHDLTGREPLYGGVPGSTDGTILYARKGIPIVTCGPGDIHIPHHIDEWVSVAEIKEAARMYVLAAMRYLGS